MLAIRLQRRGRKGHAQYRVVVQDKDRTPTSGRVVFNLGSYDPHSKVVTLNTEKAEYYLSNGAQPSDSVVRILKREGVKLPAWVKTNDSASRSIKNQEKLRKNRTEEEVAAPAPVDEAAEAPAEEVAEESKEAATEEVAAEETAPEETKPEEVEEAKA